MYGRRGAARCRRPRPALSSAAVRGVISRDRTGRAAKRAVALAAALLVPASQVAPLVHLALVRHATCPEHGELIELGAGAVHGAPAPEGSVSRSPAAGEDHEHDHCLLACQPRQDAARVVALAGSLPATERSAPGVQPASAAPGVPLLRVAPKQSPPAA